MTIYVDILFVLNLYINYFIIRSTAFLTRRELSARRGLLAAAVGALGALVILLPPLPLILSAAIKAAIGAAVVFAAFGRQPPADFAVAALFFLAVSFGFAGVMAALWEFVAPRGMAYGNGAVYFRIPISAVAVFTIIAYIVIRLIRRAADRRVRCVKVCSVGITANGGSVLLRGLPDTGNSLRDVFSGKPVIICRRAAAAPIIPRQVRDFLDGKPTEAESLRLLPCKTVSSEALIPVFPADNVTIDAAPAEALIGISEAELGGDIDCVFNPRIAPL